VERFGVWRVGDEIFKMLSIGKLVMGRKFLSGRIVGRVVVL